MNDAADPQQILLLLEEQLMLYDMCVHFECGACLVFVMLREELEWTILAVIVLASILEHLGKSSVLFWDWGSSKFSGQLHILSVALQAQGMLLARTYMPREQAEVVLYVDAKAVWMST